MDAETASDCIACLSWIVCRVEIEVLVSSVVVTFSCFALTQFDVNRWMQQAVLYKIFRAVFGRASSA